MMQWDSLQAFLDMGGYATYVWGSFGTTALLMIAEVLLLKRRLAALTRDDGDSEA